jgi:DNA-binding transcriptional ArsR family regulator
MPVAENGDLRYSQVSSRLKPLGEPVRMRIIDELGRGNRETRIIDELGRGNRDTSTIAAKLRVNPATVGRHLALMKVAGIVTFDHQSSIPVYRLTDLGRTMTAVVVALMDD